MPVRFRRGVALRYKSSAAATTSRGACDPTNAGTSIHDPQAGQGPTAEELFILSEIPHAGQRKVGIAETVAEPESG